MSNKPTRVELVAYFSSDSSAGLRGGVQQINVSFSHHELDAQDIEELRSFFKGFFDADVVITKEVYDKETARQAALEKHYQEQEERENL